jgi:hypothetical protein
VKTAEDVKCLGAFLVDDFQIGFPHIGAHEPDLGSQFVAAKVVHSIAGLGRPPVEIANASPSQEITGWNHYDFLGTIDEPANDALAMTIGRRHSTGFSSM